MIVIEQRDAARGNWQVGPGIPRRVVAAVLHVTEGTANSADAWIRDPRAQVSWHFLVTRTGVVRQYVSIHDVAYHAGRVKGATWGGLTPGVNPNAVTVGIEHEGDGVTPWSEAQLLASACLSAWLAHRFVWSIDAVHFPLHREIFADKSCPGPAFDRGNYLARVRALTSLFKADVRALVTGFR